MARGVAGSVEGADFRGEVGVFGEGVEEAEFDESLHGWAHEGDGLGLAWMSGSFGSGPGHPGGRRSGRWGRQGTNWLSCSMVFQPTWSLCRWERKTVSISGGWTFWACEVVHELTFEAADGLDGAGAVAGVDEDGLLRGVEEVAADFDEHQVFVEGVGAAPAVLVPGAGGDFGPELVVGAWGRGSSCR